VNVLDVRHSGPLLEGNKQSLQRALLALGDDFNVAAAQIPADAGEMQLLGAIKDEVAEANSLDAALNYSMQAFAAINHRLSTIVYSAATGTG